MTAGLTSNKSLLRKAELSLDDLLTDGGLLVPEQGSKFIRILIKRARLMPWVDAQTMRSPKKELNKLRFAGRVLRPGQPGVALTEAERSKPDLGRVTLDSKLFKAEVRLNNEVLEDSIERGNLKNTVMQEFSKAVSRDIEDIMINGDTASPETFYNTLDGVLKQAVSNIVIAGGVNLNKETLRDMIKARPSEFLVDKTKMKYLTSVDAEIDYRDSLSNRATATGDRALGSGTGEVKVGYSGIDVEQIPLFPETLGADTDETEVLFLDPKNIALGFQRQIRLEVDKDISAGELIMVMTMRWDVKYVEETAVVRATGIKVGS